MKLPPQRTALVAIVVLLGACLGWWLLRVRPEAGDARLVTKPETQQAGGEVGKAGAFVFAEASSVSPCTSALRQVFDARANQLSRQQEPSSQLAYALTAPFEEIPDPEKVGHTEYQRAYTRVTLERQSRIDGALLRAFTLAPEDPEVRWLAAVYCWNDEACTEPRKALLAAEPDNMTVWLRELTWARKRGNQNDVQHAFVRAANASRFENHLGAEQQVLLAAYGDLSMPAVCATPEGQRELRDISQRGNDEDVTMLDMALLLGHLMKFQSQPVMSDLRDHCKPEVFVSADAAHQVSCRKILSRLAEEGSLLERMVSLESLAAAMTGEPDEAQWRQRLREILWMHQAGAHPTVQSLLRPEDYMLNEVEGLQVALETAGLWPPPADWLPRDERSRSLIQTGRPPQETKPK